MSNDHDATTAMDVYVHRVRKYLGAYMVALNGNVDAIVFSAGIGENAADIRAAVLQKLDALGIQVDPVKNKGMVGGKQGGIHAEGSRIQVLVIPTNEELSIAQQTMDTVHYV